MSDRSDDENVLREEGTRPQSGCYPMILTGRRAAPLTLFSALRRPDREREGAGSTRRALGLTRRGSSWVACALKESGACVDQTATSPGRPRLPERPRSRTVGASGGFAGSRSSLGHLARLSRKERASRGLCCPCARRFHSIGLVTDRGG